MFTARMIDEMLSGIGQTLYMTLFSTFLAYVLGLPIGVALYVTDKNGLKLACGGGTPCFFDNIDYMNSVGHTFYMKASVQTLCDHIGMSRGERPLLKGKSSEELKEFVAAQLAEREPFYSQAQEIIDVNVLDSFDKIDHVADLICERL